MATGSEVPDTSLSDARRKNSFSIQWFDDVVRGLFTSLRTKNVDRSGMIRAVEQGVETACKANMPQFDS